MENKNLNATAANNSNNVAVYENANSAANQTVKTFALTVKRVKVVYIDDYYAKVTLTFDKQFPSFVKTKDGNFVAVNVNHIMFNRNAITRQLCELNDLIATYRDSCEGAFNRKQLSIILHGAKFTIKRTFHAAGEVIDGREEALKRDQWFTDIVGVSVSKTAATLLLSALTLA